MIASAAPRTADPEGLRLVRPVLADDVAPVMLDPSQQAVVDCVVSGADGALLVLGAPGTGKTTLVVELVAQVLARGDLEADDVLVLAASRRAAAQLRDRLAARVRVTTGRPLVRTAASAAFAVLRARASLRGEPTPTLISGPEQDLLLAELLAGHAEGEGVPLDWPTSVPAEALGLRAFRDELRDLLMRAAERGLAPADLADLGTACGRPEWVSAARLYQEYLDVTVLRQTTPDAGARFDPAVVVEEAAEALVAWDDEVPRGERPRWRLVVVDDHQESTVATARLLRVLADDGARLVLLADPDAAVQTFRGASPALVGRATVAGDGPGELGATTWTLATAWRHGPELRGVTAAVTERIGTVGTALHRNPLPTAAPARQALSLPAGPRVALLPTPAQEAAYVAHALRSAHLEHDVPWDRMAVVARSGAQVASLRRALASASVPVSVLGGDVALRDEPAVRPLLAAVRLAVDPSALDADAAATLLCSPLGGLDAVGLRRVRRALRAEELAGGGGRTSDALLVEVLADPAHAQSLPASVRREVLHVARLLAAGRRALATPGADAQTVLWALWSTAGVERGWTRAALAGGPSGARADRDLDAVLALFRAAETFVDRMPQAHPAAFVESLQSQDLPADSLAARSGGRPSVEVLTPAGAAGREWDLVVVAGVQDGTWPDLRLRDSLLGAAALAEVIAGRDAGTPSATGTGPATTAARAAVLHDELRSFAVAVSRARHALLVTAVADEEEQPSPLVDLVVAPEDAPGAVPGDDGEGPDPRRAGAPVPLDLRGLVGRLRSRLEEAASAGRTDGSPDAALLAHLARAGVPGADPAGWYGLAALSTDAPLWSEDDQVPVSPSKVEQVATCALKWALEAGGGTVADATSQSLGTLVHAIAHDLPHGTEAELRAELDRRWAELGLRPGWPSTWERRKADRMIGRLATYLATAKEAVLREATFELHLDRALLRGQVDRLEAGPGPGQVEVVDLKTGRSAASQEATAENPQLGSYQLAVDAGAFADLPPGTTSGGARLVYLGDVSKGPAQREQPPLGPEDDGPSWARTMVEDVAAQMAASTFRAVENRLCSVCPVRRSCPVHDEGEQVVR